MDIVSVSLFQHGVLTRCGATRDVFLAPSAPHSAAFTSVTQQFISLLKQIELSIIWEILMRSSCAGYHKLCRMSDVWRSAEAGWCSLQHLFKSVFYECCIIYDPRKVRLCWQWRRHTSDRRITHVSQRRGWLTMSWSQCLPIMPHSGPISFRSQRFIVKLEPVLSL